MKTRSIKQRVAMIFVLVFGGAAILAGCTSAATPAAMCGFILGNGEDGQDNKIHKLVYPNEKIKYNSETEVARYVPCSPRNYFITDGKAKDANGNTIGDRSTPSVAYTSDGTKVHVYTNSYWTLNQDEPALHNFWALCHKYTCQSSVADTAVDDANNATAGWNDMLGENYGTAVDATVFGVVAAFDDDLWRKPSHETYTAMANDISEDFKDAVRVKTGYNTDLFCGSGNSGWSNPDEPGEGEFTCSNVRFEVTSVVPADSSLLDRAQATNRAEADMAENEERLKNAIALYGPVYGPYFLALQDTMKDCANIPQCVFIFGSGGNNAPTITVPQAPAPEETQN